MALPIGPEEVSYFETASTGYIDKKTEFDRIMVISLHIHIATVGSHVDNDE
jgi:hypothetical protein